MSANNTLDIIGQEFSNAILPLKRAIQSPQVFQGFMRNLGWNVNIIPAPILNLATSISALESALGPVKSGTATLQEYENLFTALKDVTEDINDLGSADFSAFPNLLADNFLTVFPIQLLDFLVCKYLLDFHPKFGYGLKFAGIVQTNPVLPAGNRLDYIKYEMDWTGLGSFISNPVNYLGQRYQWGTNDFKAVEFLQNLQEFLYALGIMGYIEEKFPGEVATLEDNAVVPGSPLRFNLVLPIMERAVAPFYLNAGLKLLPLSEKSPRLPGLSIIPYFSGSVAAEVAINDLLTFLFSSNLDIQGGLGVVIRPNESPQIIAGFSDPQTASSVSGGFRMELRNQDAEGNPIIVFGDAGGSRMEYQSLSLSTGAHFSTQAPLDMFAELEMIEGKLVIGGGEGDGFLNKLFPEEGIEAMFSFIMGASLQNGFYFKGSSGLEINLPTHLTIGPVEISDIRIALQPNGGKVTAEIGANVTGDFGIVKATVENVGMNADIEWKGHGGNLGFADVNMGFKPPTGVGIVIDAAAVKGGGYLYFDHNNHRYAGVAELSIKNKISLKAIGLITTKLPDGTPKVSFLLIVSAEFPPMQLGFGFTLNGVGGLVGINRTMVLEELRKGVKDNSLDSILFPDDPVADAPQILSDIDRVFPVAEGRYVFGPMGMLGWGTPTLITAEIGLMIEVPNPVRIAILGVIKCLLPDENKQLLKLQVNFLGTIDFEAKFITFDASLYDSRLLTFTLSGDMALRIKWGENPNFLFTVGGFHPRYMPPPLSLPSLQRLTLNLLGGNNPRLTLSTYFAITSNTVQLGARVDFYFKVSGKIKVLGYLGFDALFQFNPFYFDISFEAGLAVYWKSKALLSISLRVRLEGPTPWHAAGEASFKILFIKAKVRFDKTWGNPATTTLPDINVQPLLVDAINNNANWTLDQSVSPNQLVTFRKASATNPNDLFIHPDKKFGFSQKIVPLDVTISRFSSQRPLGAKKWTASLHEFDGVNYTPLATTSFREDFAPASFFAMSNDQKLSRPSFEKYNAGVQAKGTDGFKGDYWREGELVYETMVMDSRFKPEPILPAPIAASHFRALLKNNAAAKSALGGKIKGKPILAPDPVKVMEHEYVIADVDDLSIFGGHTAKTMAEAQEIFDTLCEANPALQNKIQVLSKYEVA